MCKKSTQDANQANKMNLSCNDNHNSNNKAQKNLHMIQIKQIKWLFDSILII